MSKKEPTLQDIFDSLYLLELEIQSPRRRLPSSYAGSWSEVEDAKPGGDRDPVGQVGRELRLERQDEINRARSTGQRVAEMRQRRDQLVADLIAAGKVDAAEGTRITLEDAQAAAEKSLQWFEDHLDVEKGTLRLGSFDKPGFHCDVNMKVDVRRPSIEFELQCDF